MMKYTLHIAFNKHVGEILLHVCEYAKKYGSHSANHIHPIRFDFSNTNDIEIKRIGKNSPLKDFAIFAMEMFSGIPVKWITEDVTHILRDGKDIEEFFEREFSDKICQENTTLVVIGTSLGDEHINKLIENALAINTFTLMLFAFNEKQVAEFKSKFDKYGNVLVYPEPKSFSELSDVISKIQGV